MQQEQIEPVIIEDLVHIGEDIGYERGVRDGEQRGRDQGILEGLRRSLVQLMTARRLAVTEAHRQCLAACNDTARLERWIEAAVTAERADDVFGDGT